VTPDPERVVVVVGHGDREVVDDFDDFDRDKRERERLPLATDVVGIRDRHYNDSQRGFSG